MPNTTPAKPSSTREKTEARSVASINPSFRPVIPDPTGDQDNPHPVGGSPPSRLLLCSHIHPWIFFTL